MFKMIKVNNGRRQTQSHLSVRGVRGIDQQIRKFTRYFVGEWELERQLKMADSISSSTDDWEGFFQSLVDLLNDCETS